MVFWPKSQYSSWRFTNQTSTAFSYSSTYFVRRKQICTYTKKFIRQILQIYNEMYFSMHALCPWGIEFYMPCYHLIIMFPLWKGWISISKLIIRKLKQCETSYLLPRIAKLKMRGPLEVLKPNLLLRAISIKNFLGT